MQVKTWKYVGDRIIHGVNRVRNEKGDPHRDSSSTITLSFSIHLLASSIRNGVILRPMCSFSTSFCLLEYAIHQSLRYGLFFGVILRLCNRQKTYPQKSSTVSKVMSSLRDCSQLLAFDFLPGLSNQRVHELLRGCFALKLTGSLKTVTYLSPEGTARLSFWAMVKSYRGGKDRDEVCGAVSVWE